MFEHIATGGMKLRGYGPHIFQSFYPYKYEEGSSVYVLAKARLGKLERVVIKRVVLNLKHSTYNQPIFNYVDTLNEIWLEAELGPQSVAVTMAENYYERQLQRVEDQMQE